MVLCSKTSYKCVKVISSLHLCLKITMKLNIWLNNMKSKLLLEWIVKLMRKEQKRPPSSKFHDIYGMFSASCKLHCIIEWKRTETWQYNELFCNFLHPIQVTLNIFLCKFKNYQIHALLLVWNLACHAKLQNKEKFRSR